MSLSEDFPKITIDQSAETRRELLAQWPKGEWAFDRFAADQVRARHWERVCKRENGKIQPAYRKPKRSTK